MSDIRIVNDHQAGCGCKRCKRGRRGPAGATGPTGPAGPDVGFTVDPTTPTRQLDVVFTPSLTNNVLCIYTLEFSIPAAAGVAHRLPRASRSVEPARKRTR